MSRFVNISDLMHLARKASGRAVDRVYDLLWRIRRQPLPMVLLQHQRQLNASEIHRANSIIDWIEQVIEDRPAYLKQHRLSAAIHFPQAVWSLDGGGLYDGFRAVLSRDPKVLNYLRLWSQQFTGYRLLSLEPAQDRPFPHPKDVNELADEKLLAHAAAPDRWVNCFARLARKLPPELRVSPPRQFGEVGWNLEGRTVSFDGYVYLERLALMHEHGLLARLRAIASTGRTPLIVEIGGGFGGLAYHIARLVPQARIVIVDIPESLVYSSLYLSLLLPEQTHVYASPEKREEPLVPDTPGCTFVPNYLFDRLLKTELPFDLAINTLSMSEMDQSQVEYYCRGLHQLLGDEGVFFEQNWDNRPIGRLDAQQVIARQFEHCQNLDSRLVGPLTQGKARLWTKQPQSARGNRPAVQPTRTRMVPIVREFRRRPAVQSNETRIPVNSQ